MKLKEAHILGCMIEPESVVEICGKVKYENLMIYVQRFGFQDVQRSLGNLEM